MSRHSTPSKRQRISEASNEDDGVIKNALESEEHSAGRANGAADGGGTTSQTFIIDIINENEGVS